MVQTWGLVAPLKPVHEEPRLGALEARVAAASETSSDEPVGALGWLVAVSGSQGCASEPVAGPPVVERKLGFTSTPG